jgi:glycosyltransferase involved in cell wall biosynthesis
VIRVLHLLDDTGMGGVMRCVPDQIARLGDGFDHRIQVIDPSRVQLKRSDADIIVVHFTLNWAKLPFLATLRARASGAKLVIVEHSYTCAYEALRVSDRRRFRTMLRLSYALAHRVVAVSQAQADWMRAARLVAASRLTAIPQARDVSALAAVPPLMRSLGPLRLGAYGRYAAQKGFDVLIEAMRFVSPAVATLDVRGVGPDGDALRAQAKDLPHVTVGDAVTDLPAFLAEHDVIVIPSRWEAFGLVAQEARAAGRPVLAARTDGLIGQVSTDWGALVPAGNPIALADAIGGLAWKDLRSMGENARRSAQGAFDATVSAWGVLLRQLAPRTRAGETTATDKVVFVP